MTALFPLFVDLHDRPVLVVGGGVVAERKVQALREAGARIHVQAPALTPALQLLADTGLIGWYPGTFRAGALDGVWLVIAATDDATVNRAVADAASRRRVFANVVDDAVLSSFHVPAVVRRGDLQIAISSGGGAPMVARHLRRQLETWLDDSWGALTALLARERGRIRARFPETGARRLFFERLLAGPLPRLLRQRRTEQAERAFVDALTESNSPPQGSVVLVGAGPGDPGLLTLNGLRALKEGRRDPARPPGQRCGAAIGAPRRPAGGSRQVGAGPQRAPGKHPRVDAGTCAGRSPGGAAEGRRPVRVRPRRRGTGVPARAPDSLRGRPRHHRGGGLRGLRRHSPDPPRPRPVGAGGDAHCRDSLDTLDWSALARSRQTLAFYMGVAGLETVQARLSAEGCPDSTPFALIESGSRAEQRVITGRLDGLARTARHHQVRSPALLVLGEVAGLAESLHWFGSAPLAAPPHPDDLAAATLPHAA